MLQRRDKSEAMKIYPCNKAWKLIRLSDVEDPTFCLDNRHTDGGKVFSPMRRLPFTSRKISGTLFC
jgi:hypothetical protein